VSLSWPRRLEVALSPSGAAWAAGGAHGACPGEPAAAFAAALAAAPAARRVRVTLCGNLVYALALPWPAELENADEAEGAAFAAHHFRRVFGEAAAGWTFRFDAEEGGVRLACATERALLEALQEAARAAGRRLDSVQPFLAAAFNGWRGEFGAAGALFVTLEPGRWTAALLGGGGWRALRSGRLEEDVAGALVALVARETALAGDERLPVRVYAPAFPRLGAQLEGLGKRVRLLQRPVEPLYAPAAH
jgi:hypothetical protein